MPENSGWYATEVDVFQVAVASDADMFVALEWDNSPDGSANAPMNPDDTDGPWASESDLDFVLLGVVDGVLSDVVSDAGASLAYPPELPSAQRLLAGQSIAVAVGCHHGLPTTYSLTIDLRSP